MAHIDFRTLIPFPQRLPLGATGRDSALMRTGVLSNENAYPICIVSPSGFSLDEMIAPLNTGVSVETLLDLVCCRCIETVQ